MIVRPFAFWGFACAVAALLGLAGAAGAAAATAVTGWRAGDHGASTRFVLDLTGPVAFKLEPGSHPDRLRIQLPETAWRLGSQGGARPDGLIGAAEFSDPPAPPTVTLWLKGPARVTTATLVPPSEGYQYRLVIDLTAGSGPLPPPAAAPKPAPVVASPPPPRPAAPPPRKPEPVAAAHPPPAAVAPPQEEKPAPAPVAEKPPAPKQEVRAVAPPVPPPIVAAPAAPVQEAKVEPVAAPGPPLALRTARVAIEVPPPPLPPPPPPPAITPRANAAPMLPPPSPRAREESPPPPSAAPLPRIASTPLPMLPPALVEPPPAPTPAVATPAIVPAAAQLAALPAIRIIREPGRPVMVILPIPPAAPKPAPPPPDTRRIVVLDPGHGGIDPGATGLSGVHEKAITLAFALELKQQLEDSGRYRVLMTREEDNAVALRERVRIARAAHADLFLSIHADTLANRGISGLSVYTESETASDHEAEALATKENKADLIAGIDLSGAAPELTSILIDLAQRETRGRSTQLAAELVQELGSVAPLLPRTHRSAGFAVLTAPDVPSVLIELGYLSNKRDERGLTSPQQRGKLESGILKAIDRFFSMQPMLQRS